MRLPVEWITEYAPVDAEAEAVASALTMAGLEVEATEVTESGAVLDIKVTPNRGDCLSVIGVARELGAAYRVELRTVGTSDSSADEPPDAATYTSVEIEAPDLCPRYAARIVEDVRHTASPPWMQARLMAAGMRPINGIVDVTNYVMLETGQPLHAFDYAKLRRRQIVVRRARQGETLLTLDGVDRVLTDEALVIADAERPVALAGVMGGAETEITSSTSVMLLESAHFGWRSIRRTSRRLNLVTEASYRFERVVDPDGVVAAADRVCELLAELGMGRPVPGVVDVYPLPPSPRTISVRPERVGRLLGYEVSADEVADALTRLGFSVTGIAGIPSPRVRERHSERCEESACAGIAGIASPRVRERHSERCEESACAGIAGIASPRVRGEGQAPSIPSPRVRGEGQGEGLVTVPNRRPDILRETDLVEEVGRVVGYDRIPERLPAGPTSQGRDTDLAALADAIRDRLVGAGLQEVVGHSLGAPSPFDDPASDHQRIPIRSALSDELSGLRRTLLPSLLDALDRNARRGQGPLAFFEVGAVFAASRSADVPHIPSPRVRGEGQAPGIPSPRVRGEGQAPSIPSPRVRGEGQGEGRRVQHEERMALGGVVCGPLTPRSRFAGTRPETPMSVAQGLVEMLLASLGLETDFAPSLDARLHPGRQASVAVNGQTIGLFGELHPDLALHLRVRERIGVFELDCAGLQAACRARRPFVPLTPYPAVMRDLAPRVPTSVPFARVRSAVLAAGAPILDELALVDVYSGDRLPEGVRSLTLSLTFRAPDRTLTDADAEPALEAIRSRLRDECGATFVGA